MAAIRRTCSRFASPAALGLLLGGAFAALPSARAEEPPTPAAPKPAEPSAPKPRPVPAGSAEVVLGDEISVVDVLKNLAKATGSSITWSDQDKSITYKKIRSDGAVFRVDASQVFDAVRALLANDEVVLVAYGPAASRMYRAMDARMLQSQFVVKAQPEVIEVDDAMIPTLLGQGGRYVTTTIGVTNLTELREARTALQRLITQNNIGSVQEVPAARAFVVTDFAPNVAVIYRTIRQMDVPPAAVPTAESKRVSPVYMVLKHAKASKVAFALHELFDEPAPAPGPRATPTPTPGAAPAAPPSPAPRISSDDDGNQVIVIATAEDAATIADVVRHMDVEPSK
jgi:type II secretory pathway component GspD/PulD (secretin)